jgi:diguanylate cyclase
VADAFRETFRDIDLTARVGGDEFAVILPDSDLAQARAAMERFLSNLARADLRVDDYRIELGASVGVAEYARPESLDELLARADRAMYASKHRGGHAVTARGADPLDPGDGREDSRTP